MVLSSLVEAGQRRQVVLAGPQQVAAAVILLAHQPCSLQTLVTLLVGIDELRVRAAAAPEVVSRLEQRALACCGGIPLVLLAKAAVQTVVRHGEDTLHVSLVVVREHGLVVGRQLELAAVDDVVGTSQCLLIVRLSHVFLCVQIRTHQRSLCSPVVHAAVGCAVVLLAQVRQHLRQFLHHELVDLLARGLCRRLVGESRHQGHVAVVVEQDVVPQGTDGAQFGDHRLLQVTHGQRAALNLVFHAVGVVDTLIGREVGVPGLPLLRVPSVLVHASVSTAVVPSVGSCRCDDTVAGFLFQVEESLPVEDIGERPVCTGQQCSRVLLGRLEAFLRYLRIYVLVKVRAACERQHSSHGERRDAIDMFFHILCLLMS